MRLRTAALAAALLFAPLAARAQPLGWEIDANGDAQYTFDISVAGTWACEEAIFLPVGATCAAAGNTLTLSNNGAFLTLAFNGLANQRLTATNAPQRTAVLGTLTTTVSGTGPFVFPTSLLPDRPAFDLRLGYTSLGPVPSSGVARFGWRLTGSPNELPVNCCASFGG